MKILWVINFTIPRIAKAIGKTVSHVGGGWLTGISNALLETNEHQLHICIPDREIKGTKTCKTEDNLSCTFFQEEHSTEYDSRLKERFKKIIKEFRPDVVHAFGTEYPRTYSMSEAAQDMQVPFCISITGLVNPCAMKYYGSVPYKYRRKTIIRSTMSYFSHSQTLSQGKKDFEKRGVYEVKAIKNTEHIIGRTSWDQACALFINPNVNYHKCNETLRDCFYDGVWSYDKCNKHSIAVPQMGYPLKGFEKFLEGFAIIKERYPDTKVYVPGWNRFCMKDGLKKEISIWMSEYDNYLKHKITEYDLWDNIVFCGPLQDTDMKDILLSSNVFVLPSALENSPNSMGESMLLGVPTVASCVGGVQDLLTDKKEGFLYPYDEAYMMAYYVINIFENIGLAEEISREAKERAGSIYDRERNVENLVSIYNKMTMSM